MLVGTTIGKYEVRHVVGAGGAGVVLAAYDAELGRSVAIKFLTRESEDARARLMREAQAMAKLSHPNVVTVYEVLRVDERVAIVMELVNGRTLGDWQEEKRTWRETVGVYAQAARGLAAAHRAGLVHRDFKPSNALIDADGVVRVTDFGLVRAADDGEVSAAMDDEVASYGLTQTGMILGTPAYMAPEQHAGRIVDARTDQWALACSLYGALYRQRPFAGDKLSEIRTSVLADVPRDEPVTRVPKSIRAAIRRALSTEPTDRFATMDDFIHAITPRHRAWIAVAIAAGAGALAAGGIAFATAGRDVATCDGLDAPMLEAWNPVRAAILGGRFAAAGVRTGERSIAALTRYSKEWTDARVRTCEANRRGESSPDLFDRKMACLDQRLAEAGALASALVVGDRGAIDQASTAVANLHPIADCDDPRDSMPRPSALAARAEIVRGEQTFARAWTMGQLNNFIEAKPVAQEAVQISERTGWQPLVARAQLQLGLSLSHEQDGAGAVAAFDRAAAAAAKARDDSVFAETLIAKAFDIAVTLGKPDEALAMKPYVDFALERAGRPTRVQAQWLHVLGQIYFSKHQWEDAFVAETESYNVLRRIAADDNGEMIDSLVTLAIIETRRGKLERAQQLLERILATNIELHGENHATVSGDYHNLGVLMFYRKDFGAALENFERADKINRALAFDRWITPYQIGAAQAEMGRWRAAMSSFERALAIAAKQAPANSEPVAGCSFALAVLLIDAGQLDRAKPLFDRAVAAFRAVGSPNLPDALAQHARYLVATGKLDAANDAIRAAREAKGEQPASIDLAEADLARARGDWVRARAAYARTISNHSDEPTANTAAHIGIAEADVALSKPADAVTRLDERLAWLEAAHADPAAMARIRLVLARAMVASGGDRLRAKALAETARDVYAESKRAETAEAARWITSTFGK